MAIRGELTQRNANAFIMSGNGAFLRVSDFGLTQWGIRV